MYSCMCYVLKLCIELSLTITNRTDCNDYIALPQNSTFLQYVKYVLMCDLTPQRCYW